MSRLRFFPLAAPALFGSLFVLAGPASANAVTVLDSGSATACYQAALSENRSSKALDGCEAAIDNTSLSKRDLAATYANRSALMLSAHKAEAALEDADAALAIEPALTEVAVTKAGALLMLGRDLEARQTLDAAIGSLSGDALERALFNRALAHEALGDAGAAYRDFKRAAELDPGFTDATVELTRFSTAR